MKPFININSQITRYIDVEENSRIWVYSWNDEIPEEIKVNENQIIAPGNKDQHIYEVIATWDSGEISYTFVVDVR